MPVTIQPVITTRDFDRLLTFYSTDDLLDQVVRAGGRILHPPTDIPWG